MRNWLSLINPAHTLMPRGPAAASSVDAGRLAPLLAQVRRAGWPAAEAVSLLAPADEFAHPAEAGGALALPSALLRQLTLGDPARDGVLQMLDGQLLVRDAATRQWRDAEGRLISATGRPVWVDGVRVQPVDQALQPVTATLWDRIAADPALERFAAALEQAELVPLLSAGQPFTVIAPSSLGLDRAAARLGLSSAALWADRARLAGLLAHHLIPGSRASGSLPWGGSLLSWDGLPLHFSPLGLLRSGDLLLPLAPGSDRSCRNGVLHRVHEALLPPDG